MKPRWIDRLVAAWCCLTWAEFDLLTMFLTQPLDVTAGGFITLKLADEHTKVIQAKLLLSNVREGDLIQWKEISKERLEITADVIAKLKEIVGE